MGFLACVILTVLIGVAFLLKFKQSSSQSNSQNLRSPSICSLWQLINNQKEQIEKLLNFCELNWEENCLNYNKKPTAIETVSATQARKPIYKTSLNSYEKYYNYLDMFKKIEELEKA